MSTAPRRELIVVGGMEPGDSLLDTIAHRNLGFKPELGAGARDRETVLASEHLHAVPHERRWRRATQHSPRPLQHRAGDARESVGNAARRMRDAELIRDRVEIL